MWPIRDSLPWISLTIASFFASSCRAFQPDLWVFVLTSKVALSRAGNFLQTAPLDSASMGRIAEITEAHTGRIYSLAFSRGGLLASGAKDQVIAIWNLTNGRKPRRFKGHQAGVTALAFSKPIGSSWEYLISGGADNTTRIWDLQNVSARAVIQHPKTVFGVSVRSDATLAEDPDNGEFATACWDGIVRIFSLPDGLLKASLEGHERGLYSVAYSPLDGSLLASSSADTTVRIWDVRKMELLWKLTGHSDHVTSVDWSPTAPLTLASGGWDRMFLLWDLPSRTPRQHDQPRLRIQGKHHQLVWRVAFAPNGERVAVCQGALGQAPTIVFYDTSIGRVYRQIGTHKDTPLVVAWSTDGAMLASAGMDRGILVYDGRSNLSDMPQRDINDEEESNRILTELHARLENLSNATHPQEPDHNESGGFYAWSSHPVTGSVRAAYI